MPDERRLTANPTEQYITDAAISPDGTLLAFISPTGLYVRHVDPLRTEQVPLTDSIEPFSVSWFPDSRSLFVAASSKGLGTIWKVTANGTEHLGELRSRSFPRLSPDGTAYAWTDGEGVHWRAFNEANNHLATAAASDDRLLGLVWSPTSKCVAYVRARQFNKEPKPVIETINLVGAAPTVIVDDAHLLQESGYPTLGWAADGRIIYGLAEWPPHESGTTLHSMSVDPNSGQANGVATRLGSWSSVVSGNLTTSNRGELAFIKFTGQNDVYFADFDQSEKGLGIPRRLTLTERDERPTAWTPDGKSIVFMSNQNGGQHIFIQNVTSTEPQMITTGATWNTWARFTRDGLLLFWRLGAGATSDPIQPVLMSLQLPGGKPNAVLTAGKPAPLPLYSRPPPRNVQFRCPAVSGSCVLGELDGDELHLFSLDPSSGRGPELARISIKPSPWFIDWDLSPNGAWVALPRWDGQVRLVDLSTRNSVNLPIDRNCNVQSVSWNPSATGVFASAACPGKRPYKLFFVEINGTSHLLYDSPNEWISSPVSSPDGRQLAFSLKPQQADVWLLEKF